MNLQHNGIYRDDPEAFLELQKVRGAVAGRKGDGVLVRHISISRSTGLFLVSETVNRK